jgi:hypothetical protein
MQSIAQWRKKGTTLSGGKDQSRQLLTLVMLNVSRIIASTDSEEYARVAALQWQRQFGFETPNQAVHFRATT